MEDSRLIDVAAGLLEANGVRDARERADLLAAALHDLAAVTERFRVEARGLDPAFTFDAGWD